MPILTYSVKMMPLDKFIEKGHKNFQEINNANQLPTNQDFVMMVGAPWCPHCKSDIAVLNQTCKTLKKTKCLAIDGDSQQGRTIAQQIGLKVQAFPTKAFCKHDPKSNNTTCSVEVGSMPKEAFETKLKSANFV